MTISGTEYICQSQRPRCLSRRSAVSHLLRLWVRIPPETWMFVCCKCCALSGRGLRDGLITRPEESYRRWCAVVCDIETSWMRRPWPTGGCRAKKKTTSAESDVVVKKFRAVRQIQTSVALILILPLSWKTWILRRLKLVSRNNMKL